MSDSDGGRQERHHRPPTPTPTLNQRGFLETMSRGRPSVKDISQLLIGLFSTSSAERIDDKEPNDAKDQPGSKRILSRRGQKEAEAEAEEEEEEGGFKPAERNRRTRRKQQSKNIFELYISMTQSRRR